MKKSTFESPSIESNTIEELSAKLLDVTNQLSKSNEKLKREQKDREEMLANLSHDLRAPITAIRSALDYLLSGQIITKEDMDSSIHIIDRRTKTLEKLIQDMYYLFCVEDTSKLLELETVDAVFFFEEYFYDAISNRIFDSHHLFLEVEPGLSCHINIDIQKFVRVMDNLFTNAVKYSPEDSDVTLRLYSQSEKNHNNALCSDSLIIEVKDNGTGIPEDALQNVFNRTFTVSNSRTPNSETGSGLGLSIVKAIVERHDGTVRCTSELGKGSIFIIQLPCQRSINHD